MSDFSTCPIWGPNYPAEVQPTSHDVQIITSARSGGSYQITLEAISAIHDLDDSAKARLNTWIYDQRAQGNNCPLVTLAIVDYSLRRRPLPVHERADRLLKLLVERTNQIGDSIAPVRAASMGDYQWFVCSESTNSANWGGKIALDDVSEIAYLIKYLAENGWIEGRGQVRVTVAGFSQIAHEDANSDATQAFVAMWFDSKMSAAYELGIKPAILESGYESMRIDQKEHANRIDDEIIAEIRRSRFLVADFTQGDDGARGGVYYEAGFAFGLGIPVIYTCHEGSINQLAFDTRQYNHLLWNTPEGLRADLRNRIAAVIGDGPRIPASTSA